MNGTAKISELLIFLNIGCRFIPFAAHVLDVPRAYAMKRENCEFGERVIFT